MSEYLFFSLLLSGALTALWGAYRLAAVGCRVISRTALLSLLPVALMAAVLPFLLAEPEVIYASVAPAEAADAVATVVDGPVEAPAAAAAAPRSVDIWPAINAVYIAGVCLSFLYMLFTLVRIGGIIRRSERVETEGRLRVHDCDSLVPFAWGRWVVMSRADYSAYGPMLMAHERTHLHRAHWLDLMWLNLLQCLTWYWPVIWLIRRELVAAHEAEADRAVLSAGFPADEYQMLLINKASGRRFANSVTVGINHSLIKSRIIMMKKPISAAHRNMRTLALVPACAFVMFVATLPTFASKASGYLPAVVTELESPQPAGSARDRSNATMNLDNVDVYINGVKSDSEAYGALNPEIISSITVDQTAVPARIYVETKDAVTATDVESESPQPAVRVRDSSEVSYVPDGLDVYIDGERRDSDAYGALNPETVKSITVDMTAEPGRVYVESKDTVTANQDKIFTDVEELPTFPGGQDAMYAWMVKHIRYPEKAAMNDIQGTVIVRFVIEKDGSIGEVTVARGCDADLDAEAVRLVKAMPKFIPGRMNGKNVRVWYNLPVSFRFG